MLQIGKIYWKKYKNLFYNNWPLAFNITNISKLESVNELLFGAFIMPANENRRSTGAEDGKGVL